MLEKTIINNNELEILKTTILKEAKLANINHQKKHPKSSYPLNFIKELKVDKSISDQVYLFFKYKTNFVVDIQRGVKNYDTFCILVM